MQELESTMTSGTVFLRNGFGNQNTNGLHLLQLCIEFNLVIDNTIFHQKDKYKGTWMHLLITSSQESVFCKT